MTEIPFPPTLPEWMRREFREEIPKREGARALYIEHPTATIVRIVSIRTVERGLGLTLQCEGLPGFSKFRRPDGISTASIAWEYLSVAEDSWHARLVPWQLYFNAERLESLIEFAREAAEQGTTVGCPGAAYWMRKKKE